MVSGITPCARECKWIVYFGEPPNSILGHATWNLCLTALLVSHLSSPDRSAWTVLRPSRILRLRWQCVWAWGRQGARGAPPEAGGTATLAH